MKTIKTDKTNRHHDTGNQAIKKINTGILILILINQYQSNVDGDVKPYSLTHLSSAAVKEFGLRELYFSYYKVTARQQTTRTADACQLFITDFSLSVLEIT